jgi:PAS domain S-box-containing protein
VSIIVPSSDSKGEDLSGLVEDIVSNPVKYENNINENICRNGHRVWMMWTNRPILDENGQISEILAIGIDVTKQKNVEDQLRQSEKDLKKSQKIARLGSWHLDLKSNKVYWTEELYRMYGFDSAFPPPPYTKHMKLFTKDSWELLSKSLDKTRETGVPYELELETVREDGTHGWMWARGEALKDSYGKIIGLWGAAQDITDRKRVENELTLLSRHRQLALDAARLGWWQYNPVTRISKWDNRYKAIFGVKENTLPNDEILQKIIHPDDLKPLWAKVQDALDPTKQIPFSAQYRIIRPDGEIKWIEAHGNAVFENEGADQYAVDFVGTVEDITERKRWEIEHLATEQRLLLFIENAPVSIAMFDRDMRYLSCSQRWMTDFNLGLKNLNDLSHYDLFPELPERLKLVHRRAMNGEVLEAKNDLFERADGSVQWLNWEVRPWRDRNGQIGGIIIFSEDVTELKSAEKERESLHERLNHAQKMESIGRLAGGVAHDYNNMLNVIMGYTELALEKVRPDDPLHNDLSEIYDAAKRSSGVTRQLLAFARKQAAAPILVDLNEAVDGILKMMRHLIGEIIELDWKPGRDLWPIKIDPSQVDQIFANLCVNARAAIQDQGKITIETKNIVFDESKTVGLTHLQPGDYVRMDVCDDGCGMDDTIIDLIFDPFFTTKKLGEGTGLGLSTVFGIVQQNNGAISVSSTPGKGTTFTIFFPRQIPDTCIVPDEPKPDDCRYGQETILLVEDESSILNVVKRILENLGYHILSSSNPLDALRIAEEHSGKIDLQIGRAHV